MRRAGILAVVAASLAVALPAHAAAPANGVLSRSQRTAKWAGGPFAVSDPVPDPAELYDPTCREDPLCDHFSVQVTLGEGALVEVSIKTARPNPPGTFAGVTSLQPVTGDDYDVYVYDPNGVLLTGEQGATARGNEKVAFFHRKTFDGRSYDIAVRPWAVAPGSTYSGVASALSLGR